MMCEKLLKKFEVTKKDELIEALYDYQENEGQFITQEYRNTLKKSKMKVKLEKQVKI